GELAARRRSHLRLRVETLLKERVVAAADEVLGLDREVDHGFERRLDPYEVADRLFLGVLHSAPEAASGRLPQPAAASRPGAVPVPEVGRGKAEELEPAGDPDLPGLAEERAP
ncbi:MAG: hypothetical protein M3O15_04975, partial [Acidobacteriota bacterium]|nr:hypothetical protein [Acidobacteriota bacterium]